LKKKKERKKKKKRKKKKFTRDGSKKRTEKNSILSDPHPTKGRGEQPTRKGERFDVFGGEKDFSFSPKTQKRLSVTVLS